MKKDLCFFFPRVFFHESGSCCVLSQSFLHEAGFMLSSFQDIFT